MSYGHVSVNGRVVFWVVVMVLVLIMWVAAVLFWVWGVVNV